MISPLVQSVFTEAAQVFRPPPKLTISEWAERERILSSETSAEPGFYRCKRAPYQRGMMDAILDPLVEQVVLFTSAQVGKSTCLENILGYFMAQDPCPIIWMWQSLDRVKEWSGQDLMTMLRDTPALRYLVEEGSRKTRNSLLFKSFPGGALTVVGANSAGALRAKRARILLADEVDAYPPSAGAEGDPIKLVEKRQTTFWNKKRVLSSTCTIRGDSRIEAAYKDSNQQKFWVPCPHCHEFQVLKWKRLIKDFKAPHEETCYPCEGCGAALYETDKQAMLAAGEWRAERAAGLIEHSRAAHGGKGNPESCEDCQRLSQTPEIVKTAGFWINELYSPFTTWAQMVEQYAEALRQRENPQLLKTFVNLSLAETWEEQGETVESGDLMKRREHYPPPALPDGVTVVTAGIDVQADRLELEAVGFGKGEESWGVDWQRFDGDPAKPEVWQKLDDYLLKARFLHARGVYLDIAAAFVDSGFRTSEVYRWTKERNERRIFASKGLSGFGRPPLLKWNRNNRHRVKMYPVGVDVIKEILYARLKLTEHGAGYMHFSVVKHDEEYFKQLTCERLVKKYHRGFPVRYWEKPVGASNEALDMRVYAYAAFLSLSSNPGAMLEQLRKDLLAQAKQAAALRRARVDPNQMALLDMRQEEPGVQDTKATRDTQDTQAPAASSQQPVADVGFGPDEYKMAEQLDAKSGDEPPARPQRAKITFVKKGWV